MKTKTITFTLEIEVPDNVNNIAFSKDGRLLMFLDRPKLHAISDWSNYRLVNKTVTIKNYKDTRRSVKGM